MRHKDVIYLLTKQVEYDEYGVPTDVVVERKVFANQLGVSSSEFYIAGQAGLKPERQFELYEFEYKGEAQLKYNDLIYNIIRTQLKGEKIRLICERD